MAARVHVLCGPAGSGKTARLRERFAQAAGSAPGGALWIGPSRRAVDAVREALGAEGGGWLGSRLLPFQDFADEIVRVNDPTARPLPHVQRRLLADALVDELHARGGLSHFRRVIDTRGFGEAVFAFLAELKRNGVWPEEMAAAVDRLGRGPGDDPRPRQCAAIYAAYQDRLIRHELYDLEGRFWYARDLLAAGRRRPFDAVRVIVFDGFTAFTGVQHAIIAACAAFVEEVWLALPDEPGDGRAELFTRPRQTLARLAPLHPHVEAVERRPGRPAGLAHAERQMFRPVRAVEPSADADGLVCIEAPGMLGEARMVARAVKRLLRAGTQADDVLVVVRDVLPYADLLREVFADYGIPADIEGAEPLARNPAVATLLRAVRLRDDDWPFGGLTALLRSSYFRPDWPETRACPNVAQRAEALLRLVGQPRGREAYLNTIDRWAVHEPEGLEDEQAEASRRQRAHQLAGVCRPFFHRLFAAWDDVPTRAPLAEHVAAFRRFADQLGVTAAEGRDAAALDRLWLELAAWVRLQGAMGAGHAPRDAGQLHRVLGALTAEAGLPRTPRGPGRVRVLSAPLARALEADHVFLMGLGERGFPRLAAPEPFFEEGERQAFRQAGLDFVCADDLLPDEMLLFYQVLTRARRRLVVSYPAVDDKGQALLPCSFLATLLDCFGPGAVPLERRRMLIEGFDRDEPLCPAEHRVRLAPAFAASGAARRRTPELPPDLAANLAAAARVSRERVQSRTFGPYDGLLRHPAAIAELGRMFGPDKVLSPTALEAYVACPFRFFLANVLRLEPLDEPSEEIEFTQRGQAFHRALARLHEQRKAAGVHVPGDDLDNDLRRQLDRAVEEYATRGSPAADVLWRLEGQRLHRLALRYRPHWQKFLEPWADTGALPRPELLECSFGLPAEQGREAAGPLVIARDGVEVRLGGRIDRVDVAELDDGVGFWVIDYKTGRAHHYRPADARSFQRLQLLLYALAVERVLLAGRNARPLGMAYWLVAEAGPKPVLPPNPRQPTAWLADGAPWPAVREHLERWVTTLVAHIRAGTFALKPRSDHCTDTCDFGPVCRISQADPDAKDWSLPLPVLSDER